MRTVVVDGWSLVVMMAAIVLCVVVIQFLQLKLGSQRDRIIELETACGCRGAR